MILDQSLIFSDKQAMAVAASAAIVSTNYITNPQIVNAKSKSAQNDIISVDGKIFLNGIVTTVLKSDASNATVTISLYHHTSSTGITTSGALVYSKVITVDAAGANYPAGSRLFSIPLPAERLSAYLQVKIGAVTQAVDSGNCSFWLGSVIQLND